MNSQLPRGLDSFDLFGFYLPAIMIWAVIALVPCVLLCWGLRACLASTVSSVIGRCSIWRSM